MCAWKFSSEGVENPEILRNYISVNYYCMKEKQSTKWNKTKSPFNIIQHVSYVESPILEYNEKKSRNYNKKIKYTKQKIPS